MDAATLDSEANGSFTCQSTAAWGDGQTTCDTPEEDYDALTERVTTVAGATIEHFEVWGGMCACVLIFDARMIW